MKKKDMRNSIRCSIGCTGIKVLELKDLLRGKQVTFKSSSWEVLVSITNPINTFFFLVLKFHHL